MAELKVGDRVQTTTGCAHFFNKGDMGEITGKGAHDGLWVKFDRTGHRWWVPQSALRKCPLTGSR